MKACVPVRAYYFALLAFSFVSLTATAQVSEIQHLQTYLSSINENAWYDAAEAFKPAVETPAHAAADNKVNQTWIVLLTVAGVFTLLFAVFCFQSYQVKQAYSEDLRQLINELKRKNR